MNPLRDVSVRARQVHNLASASSADGMVPRSKLDIRRVQWHFCCLEIFRVSLIFGATFVLPVTPLKELVSKRKSKIPEPQKVVYDIQDFYVSEF
jgi:hypothetical protein